MREESAGDALDTSPACFLRFKFVNYLKSIENLGSLCYSTYVQSWAECALYHIINIMW